MMDYELFDDKYILWYPVLGIRIRIRSDPDLFAGSGSGNFSTDPDPGSDPLKVLIINKKR
jgi:hypothetical protein